MTENDNAYDNTIWLVSTVVYVKRLMIAVWCYIVYNMLTCCIMKNNKEYFVSTILIAYNIPVITLICKC